MLSGILMDICLIQIDDKSKVANWLTHTVVKFLRALTQFMNNISIARNSKKSANTYFILAFQDVRENIVYPASRFKL